MQNKTQHAFANIAEIAIVVVILLALNFLAYFYFFRLDMTANKEYTISQSTKNILAELSDNITAEFFLSRDLPPEFASHRDEIKNKLQEFVAYSHGKLNLRYTDPGDDEAEKERAAGLGVREFEAQVVSNDQMSTKKVFMGLALNYQDKSEAIPVLIDAASLEYQIASSLVRLTQEAKPKIGLFAGPIVLGEQQQAPSFQGIGQILGGPEGFYEVVQINPQSDKTLPEDLSAVIVCGAFGMSDSLKYSIDQFLLNGGQVIVALDPMMETGQQAAQPQAYPSLPTLETQLETYGVKFDKRLIADAQCANAPMNAGGWQILQPYVLWPKVGPDGLNKNIAAVGQLESLVLPWCCPLKDVGVPGVTYSMLASTSQGSFVISSPFDLNPKQDWDFLKTTSDSFGPFTIAAMVRGDIPTAFPDGPPPVQAPPAPEGSEPAPEPESPFKAIDQVKVGNGEGRLVVLSSAVGLSDNLLQMFKENILFVANLADMLVMGDDLLGIRSSTVTARPLVQLSDAQKSMIRWLNVLAVPILLIAFGLLLWFIKNRQRLALQRHYGG